jgi:hypothetical protein
MLVEAVPTTTTLVFRKRVSTIVHFPVLFLVVLVCLLDKGQGLGILQFVGHCPLQAETNLRVTVWVYSRQDLWYGATAMNYIFCSDYWNCFQGLGNIYYIKNQKVIFWYYYYYLFMFDYIQNMVEAFRYRTMSIPHLAIIIKQPFKSIVIYTAIICIVIMQLLLKSIHSK